MGRRHREPNQYDGTEEEESLSSQSEDHDSSNKLGCRQKKSSFWILVGVVSFLVIGGIVGAVVSVVVGNSNKPGPPPGPERPLDPFRDPMPVPPPALVNPPRTPLGVTPIAKPVDSPATSSAGGNSNR